MYHYVHDDASAPFPNLKSLGCSAFRNQVAFLKNNYRVISPFELLDAVENGSDLPPDSAVLTFDDGYRDHLVNVLPVLTESSLTAAFFPPVASTKQESLLDVNKVQTLLASTENHSKICELIKQSFNEMNLKGEIGTDFQSFYNKLSAMSRFDNPDTTFVKRALQFGLPSRVRSQLLRELFRKHVTADEKSLAEEFYLSVNEIKQLRTEGMLIGAHGSSHVWMDTLSPEHQDQEISQSLELLSQVGASTDSWVFCYPFGGHNASLRQIAIDKGCKLGLTTEARVANLSVDSFMELPRLDTNDVATT